MMTLPSVSSGKFAGVLWTGALVLQMWATSLWMCWSISRYFLVRDVKKGIWIHTMAAMACNHQAINGLSLEPLTNAKSVALKADACSSRQELSANMQEKCKTVPGYSFYESTIYIIYVWLRTCSQFTASCFSSGVSVEDEDWHQREFLVQECSRV